MKTALFFLLACSTSSVFGQGAQQMIKQRAKDQVNQSNERQGIPPSWPAQTRPGAAAAPAAPAQPAPSLPQLKADLAAIKAGATITPELKQKLATDMINGVEGTKPSQAAAAKLAEELANAFAFKPLSAENLNRFVQEIDAILNPSKFPQAKPQGIYDHIQSMFKDNGLEPKKVVAITDNLKGLKQ
jgi:hypothetical protein